MSAATPVADYMFDEIISLERETSADNAAAVALALIGGAARGYQTARGDAPAREVTRALITALGVEPSIVVTSLSD